MLSSVSNVRLKRLAAFALFGLLPLSASAAVPLPSNSTAVNGVRQTLKVHPSHVAAPLPLPPSSLHPDAAMGLKLAYGGTPVDVTTFHNDSQRTGWNPTETDLTVASVSSSKFGQLTTLNVDGAVMAQPLILSNFAVPGGPTTDILIVVTAHDQITAFDARNNYAVLWQKTLGTYQNTNDVGCGDIQDGYGIMSTPVINRTGTSTATIYLTAATEPKRYSFHTTLYAIDAATGNTIKSVEIAPSANIAGGGKISFDPQNQWNRAGLAYFNGNLYMGIGSHCDNNAGAISGWLLDYDSNLNLLRKFNTIKAPAGYELSSIWMSGFAPAIAPNGNVFVVTGNGNYDRAPGSVGLGESVLSLATGLTRLNSSFTPVDYNDLNGGDTDFGSGGVMLLPTVSGQAAPPMAVAMGKAGKLFLLNQNALGGVHPNDKGALQNFYATGGVWGGPAYYGLGNGIVYYQGNGDVLHAYSVNTGSTPSLTNTVNGTSGAGYGGSMPIISSNGTTSGSAVVWLVRRSSQVQLEAYDAVNLGNPLYQATAGNWSNPGQGNPFVSAMEANGRVYVPGYNTVAVYGLTGKTEKK